MASYKLTYFNARGRAEVARQIFIVNDIPFEDERIERDKWPDMKAYTPFHQLPILKVDNTIISQSNAINRYLAKKFGMAGRDDFEQAQVDMIVDCVEDILKPIYDLYKLTQSEKEELLKKYGQEILPEILNKLEKLLCQNKDGNGYFVSPTITWADLTFAQMIGQTEKIFSVMIQWEHFPKLKSLRERIEGHQKIAAWIEHRPQTVS